MFTFNGPYEDASSDLSMWEKVFDRTIINVVGPEIIAFDSPRFSVAAGSTRSFFITLKQAMHSFLQPLMGWKSQMMMPQ